MASKTRHLDIVVRTRSGDEVIGQALLDIEDWYRLKKYRWYTDSSGGIRRSIPQFNGASTKFAHLTEEILGKKRGKRIVKLNGDMWDYRKENLKHVPVGEVQNYLIEQDIEELTTLKYNIVGSAVDYTSRMTLKQALYEAGGLDVNVG